MIFFLASSSGKLNNFPFGQPVLKHFRGSIHLRSRENCTSHEELLATVVCKVTAISGTVARTLISLANLLCMTVVYDPEDEQGAQNLANFRPVKG